MTNSPPSLPRCVSASGVELWDWAVDLGRWAERQQRIRDLRADIAAMSRRCGSCRHWMASRTCPRERSDGSGFSRGPSMSAPICGKFEIKASHAELIANKQAALAALTAPK